MRILEIACFSKEAVEIAAEAGANRIEFCAEMETGGLTPSIDDFIELKKKVKAPIFVMLRPRAGDYIYNEEEIDQIYLELETFGYYGADGFVIGAVKEDGTLDIDALKTLVAAAEGKPCTFHRAFDEIADWKTAMDQLVEIGFKRILTSGRAGSAPQHVELIKEMNEYANGRIQILPGGGVRSSNVAGLKALGFPEFHSSACVSGELPDAAEVKNLLSAIA